VYFRGSNEMPRHDNTCIIVIDLFQLHRFSGGYLRFASVLIKALRRAIEEEFGSSGLIVALVRRDWAQMAEAEALRENADVREVYCPRGWMNLLKRELLIWKYSKHYPTSISVFPGNFATYAYVPRNSIVVVHDVKFADLPNTVPPPKRLLRRILVGRSLGKAAKIVAITYYTRERLLSLYGGQLVRKVSVVRTAFDETLLAIPPDLRVLNALGLASRSFFLTVATRQPHKNVDTLIDVFQHLRGERLVVVGDGGSNRPIPNNVVHVGHVPDKVLATLYAHAKGFLFASLYEGLGLPVLEAGAFGLPVICSNLPPLREITGGHAVAYIETPTSLSEWVSVLTKFRFEEMQYVGYKLRRFVLREFSMDRMILGYKNVLRELRET